MQTHEDSLHRNEFMKSLEAKANKMVQNGLSQITVGGPSENIMHEWESDGVLVRQMPPDEHAILRISIGGGGGTPVPCDYVVYRGNRFDCMALLKKALSALECGP